jgi:hypothetical protein
MNEEPNVILDPAGVAKPEELTPEELEQISGGTIPDHSLMHEPEGWIEP